MKLIDADKKCKELQQQVHALYYNGKPVNSFVAAKPCEKTILEDDQIYINDIPYATKYPNSFLDIWYPDDDFTKKRPTVVYFHGGGFIFGDKLTGDPLAVGKSVSMGKLKEIVNRGYNLVNVNYALAPEYRYPVQVIQVNQVIEFLQKHATECGLDMDRVVLTGGSAGADLTEIYGLVVSEPSYASRLGIEPAITSAQLKVLAIDESALDAKTFDEALHTMLGTWLGVDTEEYGSIVQEINVTEHIKGNYIPSFINSSNEGIYFVKEAQALDRVLTEYGVEHELYYRDETYGKLSHGYMDLLDKNQYAREAFERMMQFIEKHV